MNHANSDVRALCSLSTATSRVLHGEMRIDLKFLTMILIEGHSTWLDGSFCHNIGGVGTALFGQHTSDVGKLINAQMLGN